MKALTGMSCLIFMFFFSAVCQAGAGLPVLACPETAALGQPFLARLTSDDPMDSLAMTWMGRTLSPSISTWNGRYVGLAMLGTDVLTDKEGAQHLEVIARIQGKTVRLSRRIRIVPKAYPRQDLTLPSKMVTPPASVLERIETERGRTRAAKKTLSPRRLWTLPFFRPVPGKITSLYGLQRFLNKKPKNPHRGLDFRAPEGSKVRAVATGKVVLTGNHYYAGNSVYLDHGNGVVSMYFHLSRIRVSLGETVKRGQAIGRSGSTGRSTGPHLHLSVSVQGPSGGPVAPYKKRPGCADVIFLALRT